MINASTTFIFEAQGVSRPPGRGLLYRHPRHDSVLH
jgi:hypothetical protein